MQLDVFSQVNGSITKYLATFGGMHGWEVSWNHAAGRSQSEGPTVIGINLAAKSAGRFSIVHLILPD